MPKSRVGMGTVSAEVSARMTPPGGGKGRKGWSGRTGHVFPPAPHEGDEELGLLRRGQFGVVAVRLVVDDQRELDWLWERRRVSTAFARRAPGGPAGGGGRWWELT